ncbi:MAG: hypothetical protein HFI31_08200 [Lachnospiraceae bacterium]|nr:hypothetical protein [Lachnospiraceae bacterium]MCI8994663.1 hypothetical protein [Lachnospiraceae bacterium]MCI9134154.1 hypothetical protein [Lachnospiraceae bacterium]
MKKFYIIGMWIFTMVLLAGCSKFEPKEDAISVDKKGKITRVFADEFLDESGQPYDVAEIQDMMERELGQYNRKFGVDHVLLEECLVEDGILTIRITCDEAKYYMDYCSYYNDDFATEEDDVEFFVGTLGEAGDYDFDASFVDTAGTSVDGSQILSGGSGNVVILNEPVLVATPGAIQYVSDNVEILGKKQARVIPGEELKRAYIIYK